VLPEAFVALLDEVIPPNALDRARASFDAIKPTSFRINTLRTDADRVWHGLLQAGLSPKSIDWLDVALTVPADQKRALSSHELATSGAIYIQSLSSMLAPLALAPKPGEEILDLAAAPGGKTTMMAAMMRNEGRIAAVEPVRDRFFRLKGNIDRSGARIVQLYPHDGRTIGARVPSRFDRVLLDAPCSSEARFTTRDPKSFAHWSLRKVKECARKQHALLWSAFLAMKPGALLAYCTCSLSPEENELAVATLLDRAEGAASIEPWTAPIPDVSKGIVEWRGKALPPSLALATRVLPTELTDAFFLCLLRRS
jgi:tRNA (cytosine49-C5)-methyltransferase